MKALASDYCVRDLSAALAVSRSGYYAWAGRKPGQRAQADELIIGQITKLFKESGDTYGSPRMTAALRQAGQICNHKRVERLMRQKQFQGRTRRRYRPRTTDSNHDGPVAAHLLAAQPLSTAPNQVWLTDITYVRTAEGWLYLAGVMDYYSRKVVGWAMSKSLETALPLSALEMALRQRQPGRGLLHHSDRGVQYASADYRNKLQAHGVIASMSRRGNCYDNATMESFWSSLKQELIQRRRFQTRAQAAQAIFEWIEVFYNRRRLHSSLGFKSPVDFENQLN
jgi:putative transposase